MPLALFKLMQVHSFYISDTKPELIRVEFSSRFQIPSFQILGLPAPEIQEARERITSAFASEGFELPKKKLIINLAPASVRKSGTGHDFGIALKILSETVDLAWPEVAIAWGELSLDGSIRSGGRIAYLIEVLLTRMSSEFSLILGPADFIEYQRLLKWRKEQALPIPMPGRVLKVAKLKDLIELIPGPVNHSNEIPLSPLSDPRAAQEPDLLPLGNFQERIVKIGSLGRHHVLVLGPKGVGKSASFDWFRALSPLPEPGDSWERALYQESRGDRPDFDRPIRQVHAQVKPAHLLGSFGSAGFRAGELSLAHGGILFADEFPEWPRDSKECLREPLQSEKLSITRVRGTLQAKCDVQLIASGNLCPCGGFPPLLLAYGYQSKLRCRCSEPEVRSYLQKISGPILDRIDLTALFTEAPRKKEGAEPKALAQIRTEVHEARAFALDRFGKLPSRLPPLALESLLPKRDSIEKLLDASGSLRSRHKIIRVACSIQALELSSELREEHLFESKGYRFLDT